jgi:hypothetical protein
LSLGSEGSIKGRGHDATDPCAMRKERPDDFQKMNVPIML